MVRKAVAFVVRSYQHQTHLNLPRSLANPMRKLATLMVTLLALSGLPLGCYMVSSPKLCLFSEVAGVVLKGGQPVVNARVQRQYTWAWQNDRRYQDETTTDAAGRFRFPAALESSFWGRLLPHEPQILQRIDIHVGEHVYPAWSLEKRNYRIQGEVNDQALLLRCDLDLQPVAHEGGYFGLAVLVPALPDTGMRSGPP